MSAQQEFRPLQGQYPDWIFSASFGLEKMLSRASNPDASNVGCSLWAESPLRSDSAQQDSNLRPFA